MKRIGVNEWRIEGLQHSQQKNWLKQDQIDIKEKGLENEE